MCSNVTFDDEKRLIKLYQSAQLYSVITKLKNQGLLRVTLLNNISYSVKKLRYVPAQLSSYYTTSTRMSQPNLKLTIIVQ